MILILIQEAQGGGKWVGWAGGLKRLQASLHNVCYVKAGVREGFWQGTCNHGFLLK